MAEFVALPIFDEDGKETGRLLKVDTRHFLGEAGSEIAHRLITVVNKNAMYEVEVLDRIVHGLHPRRQELLGEWKDQRFEDKNIRLHSVAVVKDDVGMGSITFEEAGYYDIGESLKQGEPVKAPSHTWWRTIPGFSKYEMSNYKAIAQDGKSVSIVKGGRIDSVLLSDDEGINKRMDVDWLFKKTFPELSK